MTRRCGPRIGRVAALVVLLTVSGLVGVAWAAFSDSTQIRGSASTGLFPPVLDRVPHINGTPADGETLSVSPAVWQGPPSSIPRAYQWFRCNANLTTCTAIGTGPTYGPLPSNSAESSRYVVRETVTNGITASAVSIPTVVQDPATYLLLLRLVTTTTSMPDVTGTATVGGTLQTSPGTWVSRSLVGSLLQLLGSTYSYQWLRCGPVGNTATPTVGVNGCTPITGATSATYTPTQDDRDHRLRVRVVHSASVELDLGLLGVILLPFSGTVVSQASDAVPSP